VRNEEVINSPDTGNCVMEATESVCGVIKELRAEMSDFRAKASSMSGSGTSVFGLFDDYSDGVVAMSYLKQKAAFSEIYEIINI
jgi:4-diphosphocytidyl-2C-methyl-D-erythritol kinase